MRGFSSGRVPALAGASAVALLLTTGCDLGAPPTTYAARPWTLGAPGDVDGDAHRDLVVSVDDEEFAVLLGDGAGGFAPRFTVPHVTECDMGSTSWAVCRDVTAGLVDFDGQGRDDLLVGYTRDNGMPPPYARQERAQAVRLADGSGGFGPPIDVPAAASLRDATGDGLLDLVAVDDPFTSPSPFKVRVRPGDGQGGFGTAIATDIPAGHAIVNLAVADLDEDGHPDLLLAGTCTHGGGTYTESYLRGCIDVLLGDGSGTFTPSARMEAADPQVDNLFLPAVADLDEDGALDVVAPAMGVTMDGGGPVGALTIFPGDGAGGLGPEMTVAAVEQTVGVEVADFDADGHVDLFTMTDNQDRDYDNDFGRLLFGDGTGAFPDTHLLPTGRLRIADIDADGRPDMLRPSAEGFEVFLNRWDGRPD